MESASTYFTRRARQERTCAAYAASAVARTAHLELALRLVGAATQSVLWSRPFGGKPRVTPAAPVQDQDAGEDVSSALRDAFPLPPAGAFHQLLAAVDRAPRRA